MGRSKPATHTVDVSRVAHHGGLMPAHPCRLTKRHVILVPSHGWQFNRTSGHLVGGGMLGPWLDLDTLRELPGEE